MIRVEKLERGTYFDDAYKISFRYDPVTVNKVKELAQRRYLPGAVEITFLGGKSMIKISFANAQVKDGGYGLHVNGKRLEDIISMALGTKAKDINYGDLVLIN